MGNATIYVLWQAEQCEVKVDGEFVPYWAQTPVGYTKDGQVAADWKDQNYRRGYWTIEQHLF